MFTRWNYGTLHTEIQVRSHLEDRTLTFHTRTREDFGEKWSRWKKLTRIPADIMINLGLEVNMSTNERIDLLPCIGGRRKCKASKERIEAREDVKTRSTGWEEDYREVLRKK